ncbi:MAG TPA: hypothetical protein VHD87_17530 [Acidimicrobiales bacterium]|nr:hypothetical protein [Acidimicrobiales bacterium]
MVGLNRSDSDPKGQQASRRLRPADVVVVEHHYPDAFALLRERGPHALAVLHALLSRAALLDDGSLVACGSVRDIAAQLECVSKDSVHRALRSLVRTGVLEPYATAPSTYVAHVDGAGITVRIPNPRF